MTGSTSPLNDRSFFVKQHQVLKKVQFADCSHIHAEGNYCHIYSNEQKPLTIKVSLNQLLEKLPREIFIRVHKSYIVNINLIREIDMKERNITTSAATVPLGKTYVEDLNTRILVL